MAAVEAEAKQEISAEPSSGPSIDLSAYSHRVVSFLARNFYNLKYVALILAFCINFMLLFYKVCESVVIKKSLVLRFHEFICIHVLKGSDKKISTYGICY